MPKRPTAAEEGSNGLGAEGRSGSGASEDFGDSGDYSNWFDDLAEGVVLVESGCVTGLNRAAARLLGVTLSRAVGEPLFAVLRDHRLERVWRQGEPEVLTVQGRRLEVVPIRGGLSLRDVEAQRVASEHGRELLAVLSHELRTPMTTVRATLEALEYDDLPGGDRAALLQRAVAEADRVVRLLDDLTVQVAPPRERSVPLEEAARRVLGLLAPVLEARSVTVTSAVNGLVVWVDPDKLIQVLLNLVENAALHGPQDGEVVLAATTDHGWARITVSDQGEPLAAFEPLFAPHTRGFGSTGNGTGLGLYVVRSIVERWGGRAWGRSLLNELGAAGGNEFGLLVPLGRNPPPPPRQ